VARTPNLSHLRQAC